MIAADKEVRCEKCSQKALFYYPFRGVIAELRPALEQACPQASFSPMSETPNPPDSFSVWEHGDQDSITINYKDSVWLMNMVPKLFEWPMDAKRHIGYEICHQCGSAKKSTFAKSRYFYQFTVGDRVLVASTRQQLLTLRHYFAENRRLSEDPENDFPKVFYQKRQEIVNKLSEALASEPKA